MPNLYKMFLKDSFLLQILLSHNPPAKNIPSSTPNPLHVTCVLIMETMNTSQYTFRSTEYNNIYKPDWELKDHLVTKWTDCGKLFSQQIEVSRNTVE